tara:strand:- start:2428 stop:2751 length:324 start_codon:yes stop_codon:yes gene_type:complete
VELTDLVFNMKEEEHYTKNEIDLMHEPMIEKLDEILVETKKTNGRMSRLERWRSFIGGGLAVLSLVIIPLLIWAFSLVVDMSKIINNQDDIIKETVRQEINHYEKSI